MSYTTEHIAKALKAARTQKGISQRALSTLSGVPQSHISKIESNAVDLRLSSLVAIARALDLEIELVPRKAVPAVQSVSRSVTKAADRNPLASKELARALQATARIGPILQNTSEFEQLRSKLAELSRFQSQLFDTDAMRSIRKAIEAASKVTDQLDLKALKKAADQTAALRNAIAHSTSLELARIAKPAYHLEDDDDA